MTLRAALALGLVSISSSAALAADLVAVRVNAPATLQRAGDALELKPARVVLAGDVVSAGARGRVELKLGGHGQLTLSSLGDLQVFEAKTAMNKQPALAKLKLLAGAIRVDTRTGNGKPAQDVRLNVGSLKTRVFNADAWAANTAEGDTLCLMAGTVSVQTGEANDERLEAPGTCLRREPDGQLSRFAVASDAVIVGAIAATRFDPTSPVVDTVLAEAAAEETAVSQPVIAAAAPAPVRAAPPPAPAPAVAAASTTPATNAAAKGAWTIVVLSLTKPEPIAARAQALSAQGLPASTRTATIKGQTMHRVAVGNFATQAEARAYAAGTLAASGIKGWPAPL